MLKGLTQKDVRVGFVFGGGCGTNNARKILEKLNPEEHKHVRVLVINTDTPQLQDLLDPDKAPDGSNLRLWHDAPYQKEGRLQVIQLGKSGNGAGGDPKFGAAATREREEEIKNFLKGSDGSLDTAILVGGGGGGTGSGALPVVAELASSEKISTLSIVTMPLIRMEGKKRMKKALEACAEIRKFSTVIQTYNDRIPNKHVPYEIAWHQINDACLVPMLEWFRIMAQKVCPEKNNDNADFNATLAGGKYGLFNERIIKPDEIQKAAKMLLDENPFQDKEILTKGKKIMMMLLGPWCVDESESIADEIQKRVEGSDDDEFEINFSIDGTPFDGENRRIGIFVTAEEPPEKREPEPIERETRASMSILGLSTNGRSNGDSVVQARPAPVVAPVAIKMPTNNMIAKEKVSIPNQAGKFEEVEIESKLVRLLESATSPASVMDNDKRKELFSKIEALLPFKPNFEIMMNRLGRRTII